MKKALIIFILAAIVLFTCLLWIINSSVITGHKNILSLAVIILLVGFTIFIGLKRFTSVKRREPPEDELSKKILLKASSISYYISIYLWLFIMYFSDKTKMETDSLIGVGIMVMAMIFAISWVIICFRGIRNE